MFGPTKTKRNRILCALAVPLLIRVTLVLNRSRFSNLILKDGFPVSCLFEIKKSYVGCERLIMIAMMAKTIAMIFRFIFILTYLSV